MFTTDTVLRHLRRAQRAGLQATLTVQEWNATVAYFKNACAFCLRPHYEVLEHFIPISQGGGTTRGNCIPACASYNTCKDHPKFLLLGDRGKAKIALERVAKYLQGMKDNSFDQSLVDAYIAAQYCKVPRHHNQKEE